MITILNESIDKRHTEKLHATEERPNKYVNELTTKHQKYDREITMFSGRRYQIQNLVGIK